MKNRVSFEITSLLSEYIDEQGRDIISGPEEVVEFAITYSRHRDFSPNLISQISFFHPTHVFLSESFPIKGTYLIGIEENGEILLHMAIMIVSDRETQSVAGIQVATGHYPSKRVEVEMDYIHGAMMCKISKKRLRKIYRYIWGNLELIRPLPPEAEGHHANSK